MQSLQIPRSSFVESAGPSLDDFGGAGEQRRRKLEADRPGGLEIDDQVEFGGKADRQLARLRPAQDAVDIGCGLAEEVGTDRAVSHQTALGGKATGRIYGGQSVLGRELEDQLHLG